MFTQTGAAETPPIACAAGCHGKRWWEVDNCAEIPAGAIPEPNGTHVRAFQHRQAEEAAADAFVIYRMEWYKSGIDLGPYGTYHVTRIAQRLPFVPFPVVIQPVFDPQLNEHRRQVIVQALMAHGVPNPDARVIVAFPQAEGLSGTEAVQVFSRTASGRTFGPGGGTAGNGNAGFGGGVGNFGTGFGGVGNFRGPGY